SDVDGLALKWFRLPIRRDIGDHPVAHFGIARVQCSRLRGQSSLRPVHPDAELQSMLMRIISDNRKTSRKFLRIWIPVAHIAESSKENDGRFEHLTCLQPGLKRRRVWI